MKKKYYAVASGRTTGIFQDWDTCKDQVLGYKNPVYKSFLTYEDAQDFINKYQSTDQSRETHEKIANIEEEIANIDEKSMIAFIDGSYNDKYKVYSCGAVIFTKDKAHKYKKAYKEDDFTSMRNVAGEIKSAKYTLDYAMKNSIKRLDMYFDYSGIENWAKKLWKANNKLTKNYQEFYDTISGEIQVNFHKVKSHTDIKYNDMADLLAKEAIQEIIEE